jgi:UDP-N-acetyl-D-galactosamine dehydrogenase
MKFKDLDSNLKISVIGLGYVGLPLAIEFGKHFNTLGFDINPSRVRLLQSGTDSNKEHTPVEIESSKYLSFSSNEIDLLDTDIFIATVPTPIDDDNIPDLKAIESASMLIGKYLSKNNIVVFESTVYPGLTEEICVPIIERSSFLKLNVDFCVGYSPERINPGDRDRKLTQIIKVVSGSDDQSLEYLYQLYSRIITAGVYKAQSIKVAEAAKIIENTQRDLNIALINELSQLFSILEINIYDVLDAAKTKWNFIPFTPGLVGGHCIGVDPYYLTYKAKKVGFDPKIILSGRMINDLMPEYIGKRIIELHFKKNPHVNEPECLILGFTFKDNCSDTRNTKVSVLARYLQDQRFNIDIFDPLIEINQADKEYKLPFIPNIDTTKKYDCLILACAHDEFKWLNNADALKSLLKESGVAIDMKSFLDKELVDLNL